MEQNNPKVRNWTVIYIKKNTKENLDKLKCYSDSYETVIKRLIYRRNFDVVNNSVVDLEPTTPELNEGINIDKEVNTGLHNKDGMITIGK